MRVILGSQSASRRALLARIVPEFETRPADIDEQAIRSDDYEGLPLLLAHAKADALLPEIRREYDSGALLITSDQVVVCDGELREKPRSAEEVRRYLASYDRHPAQTNTAVVVHNTVTGVRAAGIDIARVYYRPIPKDLVERLIEEGGVFSAAGGFQVEDPLAEPYILRIDGEKESIMGLPMALTRRLLREAG